MLNKNDNILIKIITINNIVNGNKFLGKIIIRAIGKKIFNIYLKIYY